MFLLNFSIFLYTWSSQLLFLLSLSLIFLLFYLFIYIHIIFPFSGQLWGTNSLAVVIRTCSHLRCKRNRTATFKYPCKFCFFLRWRSFKVLNTKVVPFPYLTWGVIFHHLQIFTVCFLTFWSELVLACFKLQAIELNFRCFCSETCSELFQIVGPVFDQWQTVKLWACREFGHIFAYLIQNSLYEVDLYFL